MGGCRDCVVAQVIHVAGSVVDVVLSCFLLFVLSKEMTSLFNISCHALPCMKGRTDPCFFGVRRPSLGGVRGAGTR